MSLPVYSRVALSRTVALVVAPSLTAVSTGVVARKFRTADKMSVSAIDLDRSNAAPIGNFRAAESVPAMPFLFRSIEHRQNVPTGDVIVGSFERIRKVE